jgi:hypothetical protein
VAILIARPSANHPKFDTLVYRLNANNGTAKWLSFDTHVDSWTEQTLTRSPHRGTLQELWSPQQSVLWTDAPAIKSPQPVSDVVITRDVVDRGQHELQIAVTSPANVTWSRLAFAPGAQILAATINGEAAPIPPRNQSGPRVIDLRNLGGGTVNLALRVRSQSCNLLQSDRSVGLPAAVPQRPLDHIAWFGSDYTIVAHQIRFCTP